MRSMLPLTLMFSLCTPVNRFVLLFALCTATFGVARAQAPAAPAPADAPAATPADASGSEPQAKPADEAKSESKADEKQPVLRVLPAGLDPNPPSADDLKTDKLTWKGEYQATKDGQPVLGPDSRPIPVLYNAKGKRVKSKVKPLHSHPLTVVAGTLTVDGWTGKARLNYDIPGQDFLYFSAPRIGTVILSQTAFPGSREQKLALDGKTITIHVNDHDVQLASDKPLAGKKPESVWMRLDPDYRQDPRYPVMGFGAVTKPPYAWPGAKLQASKGAADAPPLPESMMPTVVSAICIAQPGKPCAAAPVKPTATPRAAAAPRTAGTASSAAAAPATPPPSH